MRILSWNVYMLPPLVKRSLQSLRTTQICERLAEHDFDLIVFQEAFTSKFRRHAAEKLVNRYPHSYYYDRGSPLFPFVGSGLFVLSQKPFKLLHKLKFTNSSGADIFAAKGVVIIEVETAGKSVHLALTHLNAGENNGSLRLHQLAEIQNALQQTKRLGVPQLIVGDLNIGVNDKEFNQALDLTKMSYLKFPHGPVATNARPSECYKTPTKKKWLDHVWVDDDKVASNSKLEILDLEFEYNGKCCPLSDHHALVAELVF